MPESKELNNFGGPENINSSDVDIIDTRKEDIDGVPSGVETWLRKVEKTSQGDNAVIRDDRTGQPVMSPAGPTTPVIQLPITKSTFRKGFKKKIDEAGRWLSEFVFRLIKMELKTEKGQIKFKDES